MHKHLVAALAFLALGAVVTPSRADAPQGAAKRQPRASLGILIETTRAGADTEGVAIRQVAQDSAAARAGLKRGDIITRIDNREIDDPDTLMNVLAQHRPGDRLSFRVNRNGQERTVNVTLGERRAARGGDGAQEGSPADEQERPDGAADRRSAFLGVQAVPADELTDRLKRRLNISGDEGVVVIEVVADSPASRAGLRHGDVIARIDGQDVSSPRELREAVTRAGAGRQVTLDVLRGNQRQELRARLEEPPVELYGSRTSGYFEPGQLTGSSQEDRRQIESLRRQVDQLEKRVRELEQDRSRK